MRIAVYIPGDLEEKVVDKCNAEGIPVSAAVRRLLEVWVLPDPTPIGPLRPRGRPFKQRPLPYRLQRWTEIIGSTAWPVRPDKGRHKNIVFVDNLGNFFDEDGDPVNPDTYESSYLPLMASCLPDWVRQPNPV